MTGNNRREYIGLCSEAYDLEKKAGDAYTCALACSFGTGASILCVYVGTDAMITASKLEDEIRMDTEGITKRTKEYKATIQGKEFKFYERKEEMDPTTYKHIVQPKINELKAAEIGKYLFFDLGIMATLLFSSGAWFLYRLSRKLFGRAEEKRKFATFVHNIDACRQYKPKNARIEVKPQTSRIIRDEAGSNGKDISDENSKVLSEETAIW